MKILKCYENFAMTGLSKVTKKKHYYVLFTRSLLEFEKQVDQWQKTPYTAVLYFVPPPNYEL